MTSNPRSDAPKVSPLSFLYFEDASVSLYLIFNPPTSAGPRFFSFRRIDTLPLV